MTKVIFQDLTQFLLKLLKDKMKFRQWLYKVNTRHGPTVLNCNVISNCYHMLMLNREGKDVIPKSIKLIAGRIAQEYNLRKKRKVLFGKIYIMQRR